jgi:hypothetical protein
MDESVVEFRGHTDVVLEEIEPRSARIIERDTIDRREQHEVTHEGRTWNQEQFRYYLTGSDREDLGWELNQHVRVRLARRGQRPALVFDPVTDEAAVPSPLLKKAGPTKPSQKDALLYIPNDMVRSLGLIEVQLMWLDDAGRLIAVEL